MVFREGKMRTIRIAAAVSILFTSISSAADYFPLKEGNQWTYTLSNGMQTTTKVIGFADVGTARCAVVETTAGWQTSREYFAADADGLKSYMIQAQGQEFRYDPPMLRLKLPYREGDAWEATVSQFGMSMTTSFQSTGRERIQTPAGTFDCVKVRSSMSMVPGQPPAVGIIYYAEGIGPVRQVVQAAGQEVTATLTATNVKPPQETRAPTESEPSGRIRCAKCGALAQAGAKFCPDCGTKLAAPPPPAAPTICPKCSAKLPSGARFCPSCGEKIAVPAAASEPDRSADAPTVQGPALERYQSADGKVVLYKPKDWQVTEGDMFGQGTYAVVVMEPQEDAVALFMTFPVGPEIKDSVGLAARCIQAIREEYPDLQATSVNSTPDRGRTIAELTLTAEGQKGTGRGYFFHTQSIGTVYLLLAKSALWEELRPTLTAITANLAFAPQGVAAVQAQGQKLVQAAPALDGTGLPAAALMKQALERPGKQVALQPAALPDQSMSIQIPQGWTLEGQKTQFILVNNAQTRTHGMGSLWHTIIPMDMPVPGAITAPYQAPPQALSLVLESGRTSRNVQVLGQSAIQEAVPEAIQVIQKMQAQGFQVDARLLHVRLQNVPTGATLRGLFSVMCSIMPMSPVWQVTVQGSWAPESEYDEWLPLFLRIERTMQINQQWMGQEMQHRAVRQQQLNRDLQRSIAESNRAFDDYMGSLQDASRSRDYISHMWSQTTLGQGTWVAENEGARVYQTDSWGIQGPEGRIDSPAYNTTNFTGRNPWTGRDLELVDTREEYERYIVNR
jgi:RNA polymerase subunit RPABC4/transcription elongation factor Spt4